ncbi:NAD(P)H-binding protein [Ignavigranum ruoffiae]|uniref:NAD-dependent epimerase/dehydratase family protein n=1 Tax=Ignavigranum ruoffiae TaxID=89093 RepID=UPI0020664A8E|nr:NAD-dependent epimerase/dehydratase family protein [Ignavigranum ruoffiae]UPQ86038.1 NAD(P)H-binding protein [Ignavigranum ruoffiae]
MKRILIFGASGFLGQEIVKQLLADQHEITAVTRSFDANQPDKFNPQIKWVEADLFAPDQWQEHLDQVDTVINLVGLFQENLEKGYTYQHVIVEAAQTIAETVGKYRPTARFIFISANLNTTATPERYRQAKSQGETASRQAVQDTVIIRPTMMYGESRPETVKQAQQILGRIQPDSKAWNNRPIEVSKVAKTIANIVSQDNPLRTYEVNDMDQ